MSEVAKWKKSIGGHHQDLTRDLPFFFSLCKSTSDHYIGATEKKAKPSKGKVDC